jgi:hypothetical protein
MTLLRQQRQIIFQRIAIKVCEARAVLSQKSDLSASSLRKLWLSTLTPGNCDSLAISVSLATLSKHESWRRFQKRACTVSLFEQKYFCVLGHEATVTAVNCY